MNISRVGVELWSGAESMAYELTSDSVSVTVADLGAHLASVILRLDEGAVEVTVGYPQDGSGPAGCHGASIGRYANRIANAAFELDGVTYQLEANDGRHQLHGGPEGFGAFAWSADAETDGGLGRVVLKHKSKAGDMGFPGKVQATAIFELEENRLTIDYRAKVDTPTPVNLTNHAYWNLGDGDGLEGHRLSVAAPTYVAVDEDKIPVEGPPHAVDGTRFDCRSPRAVVDIDEAGGYDNCFVLDPQAEVHASLEHASNRRLDLVTNQVGMQVYTGPAGSSGARGVALETQALPDTPNRSDFGDATVRPGDNYLARTQFTFSA